ncbi:MAG: MFS transporter [Mycobacterium sp.]
MKSPSNPDPRGAALKEVEMRLDRLTVGRVHRRVVWAIGLGLFFDIYEIFLSGAIGVALKSQYSVDEETLKFFMASAFLGMFVGAALLTRLADVVGRKRAFVLTLVWFSVWSLIGAFATGPYLLVASRFLAGVGIGAEYPVADAYLSEVLPRSHLGRLAALGLYVLVPRRARPRVPCASSDRARRTWCRGVANPFGPGELRRSSGVYDAAQPSRVSTLASLCRPNA